MIERDDAVRLLHTMLSSNVEQCELLQSQLTGLSATTIDEFGSLSLSSTSGQSAGDLHGVLVDAEAKDVDGVDVYALLHARDGRIYELEFYRGDGNPILGPLTDSDFTVVFPVIGRPEGW